jgi:hypothetical protein
MGLATRLLIVSVAACHPVSIASQPNVPTLAGTPEGNRCRSASLQEQPFVTEWPASEKANLETQVRQGGVVVSFSGCNMTVLTQCHTREPYYWVRTTPSSDSIEIKSEDDLYAKLPLGAASLKGELQGSGTLNMQTTITGQYRLSLQPGAMPAIEGDCAGATHIVGGLAIGAFQLDAGGVTKASLEASASVIGSTGVNSNKSKSIIRRAGDATTCINATDQYPDSSCSSPIQMFLLAVRPAGGPQQFTMGRPMGPPIGGPLEVQLVSADAETSWDVVVDGHKVCSTPCSQRIEPSRSVLLRENSNLFTRTSRVTVGNLANWQTVGGVQVKAHSTGTFNLSGLTRIGGIFYSIIGAGFLIPCLRGGDKDDPFDHSDMYCTVSGITLGMGAGLFILGNWIMDAPGHADTSPISPTF